MHVDDVRRFYDDFLESRMLRYRVEGSPRLDRATSRVLPEIRPESRVLDLGCGIGIVTERMARAASKGWVVGVDLSERNVWYARTTIRRPNLTFIPADITTDFDRLRRNLDEPVDVVTLIDVIEHIPVEARPRLFENIRKVSADGAVLVLTYPSPQYQRHLLEHHPGELQIVDNVIELKDLLREVGGFGYTIRHYSLETVWNRNEYVHCVLQTDDAITPVERTRPGLVIRGVNRLVRAARAPYLRHKYVNRVFRA